MNAYSTVLLALCALVADAALAQEETPMITAGSTVELEYTLALADGSLVHSNVGKEPIRYTHGDGSLFPALEAAFAGHVADDEVAVQLPATEAYGPVKPDLFRSVPIGEIPDEARKVGAELRAEGFEGPIRVSEVREDAVVLDFNHPLAGEELSFRVRILSVEPRLVAE